MGSRALQRCRCRLRCCRRLPPPPACLPAHRPAPPPPQPDPAVFKDTKVLTISETGLILQTVTAQQRDPDYSAPPILQKALEYCGRFSTNKNRETLDRMRACVRCLLRGWAGGPADWLAGRPIGCADMSRHAGRSSLAPHTCTRLRAPPLPPRSMLADHRLSGVELAQVGGLGRGAAAAAPDAWPAAVRRQTPAASLLVTCAAPRRASLPATCPRRWPTWGSRPRTRRAGWCPRWRSRTWKTTRCGGQGEGGPPLLCVHRRCGVLAGRLGGCGGRFAARGPAGCALARDPQVACCQVPRWRRLTVPLCVPALIPCSRAPRRWATRSWRRCCASWPRTASSSEAATLCGSAAAAATRAAAQLLHSADRLYGPA